MGDDLSIEQPWRDPHIRFFTPSTLERMLSASGYEAEVRGYAGALLADLPKIGRFLRGRQSPMYRCGWKPDAQPAGAAIYAVAVKPAT